MLEALRDFWTHDLALDLGTTATRVACPAAGVLLDEPSVVAVSESNRRVVAGGRWARQLAGRTPQSIRVVRPLERGVIADFALCEAMLRAFLRQAQRRGWRRAPRLIVAAPGCITPVERRALFHSAERAGARRVDAVPIVVAAALGAGLPIAEPAANLICDIGGGTTEVGVLSLAEIVAQQSIRTGGDAFDDALIEHLRREHGLRISRAAAERLRHEIGSATPLERPVQGEINGLDVSHSLPRRVEISNDEVRAALQEPLERIVTAIRATLDLCQPELADDLLEQGLTLTGGGALLTGLDRFLSERTGLPTRVSPVAARATIRGALICLEPTGVWRRHWQASDDDA